MSLYYFITGLKPVSLDKPLPCNPQEFMTQLRDVLGNEVLADCELIYAGCAYASFNAEERRRYWQGLISNSHHIFVKKFATQAVNVYEVIAALHAVRDSLKRERYEEELSGAFDSTSSMIGRHYHDEDFGLASRHSFFTAFKNAMANDDPLVLEHALAVYLLETIDELIGTEEFSPAAIIAYLFKLIICDRFSSFDEGEGNRILSMLINKVREGALYEQ